jgi:CelD/BcsL family acetyltransferase involved in cellulose biosynthesis
MASTFPTDSQASEMVLDDVPTQDINKHQDSAPVGLQTVTIRDFAALRAHLDAWDRLAWQAPQKIPTLLPGWLEASLRHGLEPNERWFCSFAYADGKLVGVLPIIIAPHPVLGQNFPVLRTCDRHTPSGDVLLAPDYPLPAFHALLAEVRRQVPSHVGINLRAVRRSSPIWAALEEGDGYSVYTGSRLMHSYLDVRGDFGSYFGSLGNMRRNLRRYRKRIEGRGTVSIEIRRGSSASADFFAEFLALEASGWKGRNGTALLNNPNSVAFHSAMVRNLAAQDRMEWYLIRVDDRLVAAGMGIRCGASLMLPKIAFDEDFADCMPGHLLMGEMVMDAFSRPELDEINHMSNSDWHSLWHMPKDEYVDVHLVRRSAPAAVFQLPWVALWLTYQHYIRPRIPAALKRAHRQFRRRGDRKPRRATDSPSVRLEANH